MTQVIKAREGILTKELKTIARNESIEESKLQSLIARGRVVIPANVNHRNLLPIGIGEGLRTKVNANIGTSPDFDSLQEELQKLRTVEKCRADTVMDLSTGGDISRIRREMIKATSLPFGNVPVYQMVVQKSFESQKFVEMEPAEMMEYIAMQAEDGVDFMTIHAGLTRRGLRWLEERRRVAGIVSRGGSLMAGWMFHQDRENPFYTHFDQLLEICRRYDVTLSLGDGLRPGSLMDATDHGQLEELMVLGELVDRCHHAGVQVMVEGPGHLPLSQVEINIKLQKTLCKGAPFYVLGPIVTDIAPGYDHITGAIGGALAAAAGADFLCYVTPAEHLGLPDEESVKEGIMASRIAAHAGDISKNIPGALDRDQAMSQARRDLDWDKQKKICLDPIRFEQIRKKRSTRSEACSMCGDFCVYKILEGKDI